MRHTWATRAAESGIDLVTLAAMLGHSKINMVLRYAHPTARHQAQAMQRPETWVADQRGEPGRTLAQHGALFRLHILSEMTKYLVCEGRQG